ncbi:MAG: hypothetical protein EBR82_43980 [Caulobacteraceae bacterium]|nr:hypothetical protein [Caulobacteraceae bacterium]
MKHNYVPGKAYKMRKGSKLIFIGHNPFGLSYPFIFSNEDEGLLHYNFNGFWAGRIGEEDAHDIIGEWPPEPKKVKGWVNVTMVNNRLKFSDFCDSKFVADEIAHKERVACIPIEFTEGEGL